MDPPWIDGPQWMDPDLPETQKERDRVNEKQYITDPAARDRVLTCAFCGQAYPEGTPTHKHEALAAHVRECPEHPVGIENRKLTAELSALRERVEELANTGEQFNIEAWNILRHEYGEEFRIADSDRSPWAAKMRRFLAASDAHLAALRRAGGGGS